MKSLLYYISILTISLVVCSCSKKDNNNNQQTPIGQEQVSEPNIIEAEVPEASITEQTNPEPVLESNEIIQNANFKIVPVPSQETLTISPDDVILILQTVGFSDSQIKEHAWAIRDGLSKSGAVRILIDDKAEAGLAVQGEEIMISTRSRGMFIYNIKTGWVGTQGPR